MKPLVLLVDDNESTRSALKKFLDFLDFDVVEAGNGLEGVNAFREHRDRIAFVITDFEMPILDGREMITEIKKLNPNIKTLLITGIDFNVSSKFPEPSKVLSKPLNFPTLISLCQEFSTAA